MTKLLKSRSCWMLASGLAAGLALGVALVIGTVIGMSHSAPPGWQLPETLLHATASHGSDTMALATGPIDDAEGLYVLDYLTGELHCYVMNTRTGKFNAHFAVNVVQALGVEQGRKPKYVMVTGAASFARGAGAARLADSLIYVCDTNTGNFAAFGVPWIRGLASTNRPQVGAMTLLDVGKARSVEIE